MNQIKTYNMSNLNISNTHYNYYYNKNNFKKENINLNKDPYKDIPILKWFQKTISGDICLLKNGLVRKTYTNDIKRRMFKEHRALKKLEKYSHFPKIIHVHQNTIYMTYTGISILESKHIPLNLEEQINEIIDALKTEDIFHQDLILKHVTIKGNTVYLIDFEKSMTNSELTMARKFALNTYRVLKYYDVNYLKKLVQKYIPKNNNFLTII